MRVAILTFQRSLSYGAFFQAFALAKYLSGRGHDVSIIDYMPEYRQRYFRLVGPLRWTWGGLNRGNLRSVLSIPRAFRRNHAFDGDVKRHLPLTPRQYHTLDELQQDSLAFDACVLGSDQIWNPENTGGELDEAFFGRFGNDSMLRVSYAASFGHGDLPEHVRKPLRSLLQGLDHISVRENSGIGIVQRESGKHAVETLDPTFLIDSSAFPHRKPDASRNPYVLGYLLQPTAEKVALFEQVCLKKRMPGHRVDEICRSNLGWRFLGPEALLSWLRGAAHVVTDSFHGLALSLIHQVNVTPLCLTGHESGKNERLRNLLANVDLSERLFDPSCSDESTLNTEPVDWCTVGSRLSQLQSHSKAYLDDALHRN